MSADAVLASPGPRLERIESLDVLRGFAVFGILMMNVQSFAMPYGARMEGWESIVWRVTTVLLDSKFIALFSMLFGVGALIFLGEAPKTERKLAFARRMFWLFAFGFAHCYLIWWGDILTTYAIAGSIVAWARFWSPVRLIATGAALAFGKAGLSAAVYWLLPGAGNYSNRWDAAASVLMPWPTRIGALFDDSFEIQSSIFLDAGLWSAGLMMVGMGLFKTGFFTGGWTARLLARSGICAAMIAGALFAASIFVLDLWTMNLFACLPLAFSYACFVVLACRGGRPRFLLTRIAAIGRTALSSYLTHSVVLALIFYGPPGLGLFGSVDRLSQLGIACAIYGAQLVVAPAWLKRFQFGPMEWVWRSLTHRRMQQGRVDGRGA